MMWRLLFFHSHAPQQMNFLHFSLLSYLLLSLIFHHCQNFALIALSNNNNNNNNNHPISDNTAQSQRTAYARGTKTIDGVTYEYIFENGIETLHVYGKLPPDFEYEKEMSHFRISLGLDPTSTRFTQTKGDSSVSDTTKNNANVQRQSKTLFESFTEYFGGSEFVTHVKHYYNNMGRDELEEQIHRAKEERANIEDDLSKILTQQLVLKKRQADLGLYIEEAMKKPLSQRNPTVEDLVLTEDDRLMLLENRLKRIRDKLLKQKEEIDNFLRLHGEGNSISSMATTPSTPQHTEHHVFTQPFSSATMTSSESNKKEKT